MTAIKDDGWSSGGVYSPQHYNWPIGNLAKNAWPDNNHYGQVYIGFEQALQFTMLQVQASTFALYFLFPLLC